MKQTITIILVCFFMVSVLYGQAPKFKKVSKEELLLTKSEMDSEAAAEYLYHGCRVEYSYNAPKDRFEVIYHFHDRIKIYNDKGNKYSDRVINLSKGRIKSTSEKVSGLEAYTFYLEGDKIEKTKLNKKNIYKEEINKYRKQVKFAMPAVSAGCVMDIKYKLVSPYYFSIDEFYFQQDIPIRLTEFKIKVPEYYNYNYNIKGLAQLELEEEAVPGSFKYNFTNKMKNNSGMIKNERGSRVVNFLNKKKHYTGVNIPAVKDEKYVYTMNNYKSSLKMELLSTKFPGSQVHYYTKTWNDIASLLHESDGFGKQLRDNYKSENSIVEAVEGKTDQEKIAYIYNAVQQKFSWNEYNSATADKGIGKMIKEGSGNSAEINLLLTNLLQKAGLNALPMVSRLSHHGFLNITNPSITDLNYLTSVVLDNTGAMIAILDASHKNLIPNMLPSKALNLKGIIIDGKNGREISMPNPNKGSMSEVYGLALNGDNLEGTYKCIKKGYEAIDSKGRYASEEEYIESLFDDDTKLTNVNVTEFSDRSTKIKTEADISMNGFVQELDNKIFIDLYIGQKELSNVLAAETREFALFFPSLYSSTNIVKVKIPEGYKAEFIPEPLIIATPEMLVKYLVETKIDGDEIVTMVRSSINETIIDPKYYEPLKTLYSQVDAKLKEKVILSKI